MWRCRIGRVKRKKGGSRERGWREGGKERERDIQGEKELEIGRQRGEVERETDRQTERKQERAIETHLSDLPLILILSVYTDFLSVKLDKIQVSLWYSEGISIFSFLSETGIFF